MVLSFTPLGDLQENVDTQLLAKAVNINGVFICPEGKKALFNNISAVLDSVGTDASYTISVYQIDTNAPVNRFSLSSTMGSVGTRANVPAGLVLMPAQILGILGNNNAVNGGADISTSYRLYPI